MLIKIGVPVDEINQNRQNNTCEGVFCKEAGQVDFNGGSMLYIISWEKNRCQDTGLKYTSYVISNFRSVSVVFDDYPENVTTTNDTHKCRLAISREIRIHL